MGVLVDVTVGVGVTVGVTDGVRVREAVAVGVRVGDAVGVAVSVGVRVGGRVTVAVNVEVGVRVMVGRGAPCPRNANDAITLPAVPVALAMAVKVPVVVGVNVKESRSTRSLPSSIGKLAGCPALGSLHSASSGVTEKLAIMPAIETVAMVPPCPHTSPRNTSAAMVADCPMIVVGKTMVWSGLGVGEGVGVGNAGAIAMFDA